MRVQSWCNRVLIDCVVRGTTVTMVHAVLAIALAALAVALALGLPHPWHRAAVVVLVRVNVRRGATLHTSHYSHTCVGSMMLVGDHM